MRKAFIPYSPELAAGQMVRFLFLACEVPENNGSFSLVHHVPENYDAGGAADERNWLYYKMWGSSTAYRGGSLIGNFRQTVQNGSEAQFLVAQNDLNAVWISGKTGDESLAADAVRAETVCTDTGLSTGSFGSHADCIWRTGHGVDA